MSQGQHLHGCCAGTCVDGQTVHRIIMRRVCGMRGRDELTAFRCGNPMSLICHTPLLVCVRLAQ